MSVELPRRFTQAWIERTLPSLTGADADVVIAALRAKGWSEDELRARVYPYLPRSRRAVAGVESGGVNHEEPTGHASGRRQHSRNTKLSLPQLSAVAGIVGAVAAVLALFQPFAASQGERAPKREAASSASRGNDRPEKRLRQQIPASVRATCSGDAELRKKFGSSAQLTCTLAGADQVKYFSFSSPEAMRAAYRPAARRLSSGPCGKAWNVESSYHTDESSAVGRLRCYTNKGTAWIEWTRDDLLVYAYASRDDGNQRKLFKAWNSAGPDG